nr:DUF5686 family protein [Hoylesella enoeca]
MKRLFRIYITGLICTLSSTVSAQTITGVVTDAQTGDTVAFPSASYQGHQVAMSGDIAGRYSISKHVGWVLTISSVGYKSQSIVIRENTPGVLNVRLKPDTKQLAEVVVRHKRGKYSRKNNPAVELMRRVIAAKKRTDLDHHDFYQYNKYQKLTLAFNDLTPSDFDSGLLKKRKWLTDQVEFCPYNKKLILPVSVDETVTRHIYRKNPKSEKNIITGQSSTGINQLIQTGDILNTMMKDIFTDIDIYDDQIRLLQHPFTSPIGKDAIGFYRYYIEDTVYVDKDRCYHLQFLPNNQQDFGFSGELYILADSTLHVKQCNLRLPKKSDVNFVQNLQVKQTYTQLSDGEWALADDDMIVELSMAKFMQKLIIIRTTRLNDYAFDPLPNKLFKGKARERHEADAMMRGEDFWNKYRAVELTKSESSMDAFVRRIQQINGFKYIIFGAKALIENFVETGDPTHPSKVDIGPINTMITRNFIDGVRTRISAQTTANLNPHWFLSGYYAHGWGSRKNYYKGELTYSFNKKEYLPREFPKRTLTFTSTYDITSPSDKFVHTDKDNVFTALKWTKVDKMMFYNRQQLTFEREEEWGFKTTLGLKTEANEAAGTLFFQPLRYPDPRLAALMANLPNLEAGKLLHNGKIRTTELNLKFEISPGRTYINTKQRRIPINLDAPIFSLSHTMGIKGLLGGEYKYNFTELGIYKRFWLNSWGKIDTRIKVGAQWNRVPFPLLIMPPANLSFIVEDESFGLINNMEFLNDRSATAELGWDLNGKLFNRIPLLKKLKWREFLGARCLWGRLTDKNNPTLAQNASDDILMQFPDGCNIMNPKRPYVELVAGVHNIFKILHIEYVRRMTYNHLPTAHKQGVRLKMILTF